MDNTANIPLGTPREGSWEQGCLTKHGGKGAWMGQAWKKILASRQCNRHNDRGWEAVSSPPQSAHYQEAHQCMSPENKAWKPHVPPHSALPPPHVCPLLFFQYEMSAGGGGVLAHMRVISLRGLTFKLRHYMPEATAANGTWGIQFRLQQDQSDKEVFALYQAFTSQTLKVGFVMMLASDWGSVFTRHASCRENVCGAYESRRGLELKDEIQLWQEQEEKEECSSIFNPIVRHYYCSLPQDHGQAQPQV